MNDSPGPTPAFGELWLLLPPGGRWSSAFAALPCALQGQVMHIEADGSLRWCYSLSCQASERFFFLFFCSRQQCRRRRQGEGGILLTVLPVFTSTCLNLDGGGRQTVSVLPPYFLLLPISKSLHCLSCADQRRRSKVVFGSSCMATHTPPKPEKGPLIASWWAVCLQKPILFLVTYRIGM